MNFLRSACLTLRQILAVVACFGLIVTGAAGSDELHAVTAEGHTELTLVRPSGSAVRVVLSQTKLGDSYPYKDALLWGGDVGELPRTVLISIQVKDGDEIIFVPLSAYGDLGDVKWVSLDRTAKGYVLHLHGGDTAASYDAALTFDRGYLVSRTVALREFREQRWEKTSYSFPKRSQ